MQHFFVRKISIISCTIFIFLSNSLAGYGDVSDGIPSWKERQILVLTNACRMSLIQYRDIYVGNYAILIKYRAVAPLYFNPNLGKSARAHALDMGDTCGVMQHNSCNGTEWDDRIKSYYKASQTIGENIAVGNIDPFNTMNQWIKDIPQGSNQPAADSSWCTTSTNNRYQCDGHRSNIMSPGYKELGMGYTYGANSAVRFHDFWVQDFGGGVGQMAVSNPIVGGTHFLRESGKTTFLANYWDPALKAPAEASVYIAGQKYAMALDMGKDYQGTYELVISRGTGCRTYFFSFIDGSGKAWRYPEQCSLVSTNEGECTQEYTSAQSVSSDEIKSIQQARHGTLQSFFVNNTISIVIRKNSVSLHSTSLLNCEGTIIQNKKWPVSCIPLISPGATKLQMVVEKAIPTGIYFLVHRFSDTYCIFEKVGIMNQ